MIRPLVPDDVAASRQVTYDALLALGEDMPEDTPEVVARGHARIAYLQQTDPDSAWVAEEDGRVVGCSLALVREGMWFLSLLMVDPAHQSRGLGRQLLDASLQTATDRSWILATTDPGALRRYRRAGFELIPCLTAKGTVDRALLPGTSVREGTWPEHGSLVDDVTRHVRGAGLSQDLPYLDRMGFRLFVADAGYAILRSAGLVSLAAKDPGTAAELLWTVLAEAPDPVEVDWLAHDQQWAIDVCLEARLPLLKGEGHVFLRGQPPMSPYLPSGALG
ncbi:MAG: family N-acetyltransferase [Frankiales bacterium]|nr:family N-acetyltransferase [Frankiales bacterium]